MAFMNREPTLGDKVAGVMVETNMMLSRHIEANSQNSLKRAEILLDGAERLMLIDHESAATRGRAAGFIGNSVYEYHICEQQLEMEHPSHGSYRLTPRISAIASSLEELFTDILRGRPEGNLVLFRIQDLRESLTNYLRDPDVPPGLKEAYQRAYRPSLQAIEEIRKELAEAQRKE